MVTKCVIIGLVCSCAVPALAQTNSLEPVTVRELNVILTERSRAIDQKFESLEKSIALTLSALERSNNAALTAAKEAVIKAEVAAEKRFDSVNEFRNTLKDQQGTLATKTDMDTRFRYVEQKLAEIDARLNKTSGGLDAATWIWAAVISFAGLVMGMLGAYRSTLAARGMERLSTANKIK